MFPEDSQTPAGQPPLDGSSLSKLRDFEKVRERIVLRIEPRHVAQVLLAALLLAAVAFVGGYVVGARGYRPAWLGDAVTGPAVAGAAPSSGQARALATEIAQPGGPDAQAAAADVAVQAAAEASAVAATGGSASAVAAGAAGELPVADPGEQVIAAAATAVQAAAAVAPSAPSAQPADSADPAPLGSESAGAEAANPESAPQAESGPAAAAGADAVGGAAAPAAPPRVPRAGRPAAGKYMVQIKAFRAQVDADAFAEELRAKGYTVAVSAVDVEDKGQFFRVRMGPFGTLDAARAAQKKLEQAEGHATIILATP